MEPSLLFIGGTGTISASCVAEAVELGFRVSVLNRGVSALRPLPEGVESVHADIGDDASVRAALAGRDFDVVADFLSFMTDRLERNVDLFTGRVGQYVFISSASAYAKPVPSLPIRESTPLRNPFWAYSRNKIACEELLTARHRDAGFPMTIVRPSHTYDEYSIPLIGGWTQVARMRAGRPVLIHGDGTSLWTMTHAGDFAYGFAGLLGHPAAIGETYHITGDEVLSWDAIALALARAAGVHEPHLVHVSSEAIARRLPQVGPTLVGDKAHSVVFDNSKVRALRPGFAQQVPWHVGARWILEAHDARPDLQRIDADLEAAIDDLTRGG